MEHAVKVNIGSVSISLVKSFTIDQAFYEHHKFECSFYGDVIKGNAGANALEHYKVWLGETIEINLDAGKLEFKGVICDLKYTPDGIAGTITVSGYSPTILLESAAGHYESYTKVTLQEIVDKVRTKVTDPVLSWSTSGLSRSLSYLAQYNESNFTFLRRVLSGSGVFFYYTGKVLQCGKPAGDAEVQLHLTDCKDLEIGGHVRPLSFKRYNYDYTKPEHEIKTQNRMPGSTPLTTHLYKESKVLFTAEDISPSKLAVFTPLELFRYVKIETETEMSKMVSVKGQSRKATVGIGGKINVLNNHQHRDIDLGKFLITQIQHEYTSGGGYMNSFYGISGEVKILGADQLKYPVAQPQIGFVKETEDPLKLGRVRVQLLWQQDTAEMTDWIQVEVLSAGEKNTGTTFIPKLNDEVMVGFKYGNPDLPFVMGSLVSSARPSGIDPVDESLIGLGNAAGLYLRSALGAEEIGLVDTDGDAIHIDTDANLMTIQASDELRFSGGPAANINIKADTIKITVTEKMNLGSRETEVVADVGRNFSVNMAADYSLNAKRIHQKANSVSPVPVNISI